MVIFSNAIYYTDFVQIDKLLWRYTRHSNCIYAYRRLYDYYYYVCGYMCISQESLTGSDESDLIGEFTLSVHVMQQHLLEFMLNRIQLIYCRRICVRIPRD